MNQPVKFSLIFSALVLLLFFCSKPFVKELDIEIFAYLFYYIVISLFLIFLLHLLVEALFSRYRSYQKTRLLWLFIIVFSVLDILAYQAGGGPIIMEIFKSLAYNSASLGFNNLGVYLIFVCSALIAYAIAYKMKRVKNPHEM